jgi:hypothetical protein
MPKAKKTELTPAQKAARTRAANKQHEERAKQVRDDWEARERRAEARERRAEERAEERHELECQLLRAQIARSAISQAEELAEVFNQIMGQVLPMIAPGQAQCGGQPENPFAGKPFPNEPGPETGDEAEAYTPPRGKILKGPNRKGR